MPLSIVPPVDSTTPLSTSRHSCSSSGMSPSEIPHVTIVECLHGIHTRFDCIIVELTGTPVVPLSSSCRSSHSTFLGTHSRCLSPHKITQLLLLLPSPVRASCPCSSSSPLLLLLSGRLPLSVLLVHGILSCTLLWRCSSQSFATSHGLLGSSPTLCPSASPRPLTCIYTAGHPTLQSTSAIAGIITPPVFLHFDSTTPCSCSC